MLSRPEIGTHEHIKLWLSSKNPDEGYRWQNPLDCPCGQYAREFYGPDYKWINMIGVPPALIKLNTLAERAKGRTFGSLYELVKDW